MQIEEDVIQTRWITSSKICTALHIIRQPNSIFVLLFVQIISACTVSGKKNRCFILQIILNMKLQALLTTRLRTICTEGDLVY